MPAIDLARRVASASVAQTIRVWSSGTVSSQSPRRFISTRTVISIMRTPESEREQTAGTSSPRLSWFEAIVVLNRGGAYRGTTLVSLWETTVVTTSTSLGAEGAFAPIAVCDEATGPSINSLSRLVRSYDGQKSRPRGPASLENQISFRPSAVQVDRALDHPAKAAQEPWAVISVHRRTTIDAGTVSTWPEPARSNTSSEIRTKAGPRPGTATVHTMRRQPPIRPRSSAYSTSSERRASPSLPWIRLRCDSTVRLER